MKNIVLDMQSVLYAQALRRVLTQELEECQVTLSPRPEDTAAQCRLLRPAALLMEVNGFEPWTPEKRLALWAEVKRAVPGCKSLLMVDDGASPALLEQVKHAKQTGAVDAFLFTSATEGYLAAVLDSL